MSEDSFNHNLHNLHHEREFLLEKLLNSNFDSLSVTSRNSQESSEREISIPKEIIKQLESQMLHSDLKRESFRARTGTKNFCLNPLFEEGFCTKLSDETYLNSENNICRRETLPSSTSSIISLDEIKANCVENIFLDLDKIRRSGSENSGDSDRPTFAAERCLSLKRTERKLK